MIEFTVAFAVTKFALGARDRATQVMRFLYFALGDASNCVPHLLLA